MQYREISDDELLMMVNDHDDKAKDILYEKYKYIVDYFIKVKIFILT